MIQERELAFTTHQRIFWVTQSDFLPETIEYLPIKSGGDMTIALVDLETGNLKL
jgi:hypothetical protein